MSLVLSPDYTEKLYDDIVEACLKNEKIVRIVESVYQKTKETPLFIRHINASKTEETKHFNLLFRNIVKDVLSEKVKEELCQEPSYKQKYLSSTNSLDSLWSISTEDLNLFDEY